MVEKNIILKNKHIINTFNNRKTYIQFNPEILCVSQIKVLMHFVRLQYLFLVGKLLLLWFHLKIQKE